MILNEEYNTEELSNLKTFSKQKQWCLDNCESYISSGSSRYVFVIPGNKVIKLAKNKKGLAQNEAEVTLFEDAYAPSNLAIIFNYDKKNYHWLEMEYCDKLLASRFKQLTGVSWQTFIDAVNNANFNLRPKHYYVKRKITEEEVYDLDIYSTIEDLMANYDHKIWDYTRLSTYGVNANNEIKIIDYGLNENVYEEYYNR